MKIALPIDAFAKLKLSPQANNQEILIRVMAKMRENPKQMLEWAECQKLLLNPSTRFLIDFLYTFDENCLDQ